MVKLQIGDFIAYISDKQAAKLVDKYSKLRGTIYKNWAEDEAKQTVVSIIEQVQDIEPNRDRDRESIVFIRPRGDYLISFSYVLEKLQEVHPAASGKLLTKILRELGLETMWDTNYRIYSKQSKRWIKL